MGSCPTTAVEVRASDRIIGEGLIGRLSSVPGLVLLDGARSVEADVLVYGTGRVSAPVLRYLRGVADIRDVPVVLVAGHVDDEKLGPLVECNVASIVPSADATESLLGHAVRAAANDAAVMPARLTRKLIVELRRVQRILRTEQGLGAEGLDAREIDVLRLVAEGASNGEIACELRYSERTVKNLLHAVQVRHGLQSRSHAVAYALRAGSI